MRHTIIDHTIGKHRQTCLNIRGETIEDYPSTPEDEKSPWMSCSRDISWCLWEVARRLTLSEEIDRDHQTFKLIYKFKLQIQREWGGDCGPTDTN